MISRFTHSCWAICTIILGALVIFAVTPPASGDNRGIDGCILAFDPAVGKWILRNDTGNLRNHPYPPGSTIKPFTALAALEEGAGGGAIIRCEPSRPTTPVRNSCWYRPGHGTVNLEKALAVSCNRYFLEMSRTVDWRHFLDVLERFELIQLPSRAALENIPPEERPDVMVGLSVALRVSPSALLRAYAALFNGGYLFEDRGGREMAIKRRVNIENRIIRTLKAGMEDATRYGTAAQVGKHYGELNVLSKTGTAIFTSGASVDRNRTHAWYLGLAPADTPRRAMVIFLNEGTGSHDAVPAALRLWPRIIDDAPL